MSLRSSILPRPACMWQSEMRPRVAAVRRHHADADACHFVLVQAARTALMHCIVQQPPMQCCLVALLFCCSALLDLACHPRCHTAGYTWKDSACLICSMVQELAASPRLPSASDSQGSHQDTIPAVHAVACRTPDSDPGADPGSFCALMFTSVVEECELLARSIGGGLCR